MTRRLRNSNDNRDRGTWFVLVMRQVDPGLFVSPARIIISRDCAATLRKLQRTAVRRVEVAALFAMFDRQMAFAAREAFRQVMDPHALVGDWFDLTAEQVIQAMCENINSYITHHLRIEDAADQHVLRAFFGVESAESNLASARPASGAARHHPLPPLSKSARPVPVLAHERARPA